MAEAPLEEAMATLRSAEWFRMYVRSHAEVPNLRQWSEGADLSTWAHESGVREGYLLAFNHLGLVELIEDEKP